MDLETAYKAHFACVWRTLRRLGIREKDASDATQEVFLIAFRRRDAFEHRSSTKTWLLGIAYGVAANQRRSALSRHEVLDADAGNLEPGGVDSLEQLQRRDELRQLDQLLQALPLEQRAVFTMFELEGLTGEEIAVALEIPLGTVRSRLRLAREAFSRGVTAARGREQALRCGGTP